MATGMGAAMAGVGQATQALSSLPLVGSLAGATGGIGARDVEVTHKKRLLEALSSLPLLGSVLGGVGGGGKVKRGTVNSALYPKLDNLPDMGSAGLVNLGSNNKREAQLDMLKGLPLVGSILGGKAKRQLDALKGLPIVGSLLGAATKREASPRPQLDAIKDLPIVGGLISGPKPPKAKRAEFGLDGIKKMVATVADIRGVTSKREAAATPEEGDFRQELRKANKAKVDGELSNAADKAERKIKIKNTKFPPGGKVKSPQEALDKREESVVEKRGGLDTLPVKDIAESMTGLKSALDLLKNANAAMQNMSGK